MLAAWRCAARAAACAAALETLEREARGSGESHAARFSRRSIARATLGEVCDTLRGVFGTYRPGAKNA